MKNALIAAGAIVTKGVKDIMNLENIKLIIWDLDETFWSGTLSEQTVTPITKNIKLVKALTNRGIINSICSKNDYDVVLNEFQKDIYENVIDYFVFNSINWTPKGKRIKEIIENMSLRPINVLFIDDNISNLEEVKFYNKDINVSLPNIIDTIEDNVDKLGKNDTNLSRLKQYKVLENKLHVKENYSSNNDFLKASNIFVSINKNCLPEEERILELLNRSNQMNYTKKRLTKKELHKTLLNKKYENAFIKAKDNFGEYGTIGFYSLNKETNVLEHFLFSCRVLGMGIDQFIYQELKFPQLNKVGELSSSVEPNITVDWISIKNYNNNINNKNKLNIKILLKGACDLDSVAQYININKIDKELIHTNPKGPYTIARECFTQIVQGYNLSKSFCNKIIKESKILSEEDFTTKLFDNNYDYIILSTLMETTTPIYRHKKEGYYVPYGLVDTNFTNKDNWDKLKNEKLPTYGIKFNDELLNELNEKFEYIGLPNEYDVLKNVKFIRDKLPNKTKLILILASEIDCENVNTIGYSCVSKQAKKINKILQENFSHKDNVMFLNITDCIASQEDFNGCTNHYSRRVYYKMAKIINNLLGINKNIKINYKQIFNNYLKYIFTLLKWTLLFNKREHYKKKLIIIKKEILPFS